MLGADEAWTAFQKQWGIGATHQWPDVYAGGTRSFADDAGKLIDESHHSFAPSADACLPVVVDDGKARIHTMSNIAPTARKCHFIVSLQHHIR